MSPIRLMVGLGNPGERYVRTRHNVGRMWVEAIAARLGASWQKSTPCHGMLAKANVDGITRYLLCPETFMNLSGQAVGGACQYFKLTPEQVLIVHDELDLPPGTVRFKTGGGSGGHNGLKSVHSHLGTNDYHRLRLGVGRPRGTTESYVLTPPNAQEKSAIEVAMALAMKEVDSIWSGEIQALMRVLHGPQKGEH